MLALEGMAALTAAQGQYEAAASSSSAAARLLGVTEAWHQRFFYIRLPRESKEREACVAMLRHAMGKQAFTVAFAEGRP